MVLTPQTPIVNDGLLYANGLSLQYISATLLDLTTGAARDSTDTNDIIIQFPAVINTAIVGLDGLDTGFLIASRTYAVYAIGDSTGYKISGSIVSLSATRPNLPSGYDMFRRVGWFATNSSAQIVKFYQYGTDETRSYYYDVDDDQGTNVLPVPGTSITFAPVTLSPVVPPIAAQVMFSADYNASAVGHYVSFQPFAATSTVGMLTLGAGVVSVQSLSFSVPCQLDSGVPKILYKVEAADVLDLFVKGYVDYLS